MRQKQQLKSLIALLTLLLTLLLVACGSGGLVQPAQETATPIATQRLEPTPVPLEVESATETSPPTAPPPTETIEPTTLPLEPTATTVPITEGVTVGGYTFSYPQEVPDGRGPIKIVGWSNSQPDEILEARNNQLVTINVYNGQIREFSPVYSSSLVLRAIWSLKNDTLAFIPGGETFKKEIWVSGADEERAVVPLLTEVYPYPIFNGTDQSFVVYNPDAQSATVYGEGDQKQQPFAEIDQILTTLSTRERQSQDREKNPLRLYSVSSPDNRWTAIYNEKRLYLVDIASGENRPVDLVYDGKREGGYVIQEAQWSPDGQKIALTINEGYLPIRFQELFIVTVEEGYLEKIETGFRFVQDITWAPDSEHLLIPVITGEAYSEEKGFGYDTSALYLVNIYSKDVSHVDLFPPDVALGFGWGIYWSPDGRKIAIGAVYHPLGNPQLYRIDVRQAGP